MQGYYFEALYEHWEHVTNLGSQGCIRIDPSFEAGDEAEFSYDMLCCDVAFHASPLTYSSWQNAYSSLAHCIRR